MKRKPELRTLSEDHHHGLVQARWLRKAAEGDEPIRWKPRQVDSYISGRRSNQDPLRAGGRGSPPVLQRHGGRRGDVVRDRVAVLEHAEDQGLIHGAQRRGDTQNRRPRRSRWIGEQLEEHHEVRGARRFPYDREHPPRGGLKEVASRLEARQTSLGTEPWVPTEGFSYDPWPGPGDSEGRAVGTEEAGACRGPGLR